MKPTRKIIRVTTVAISLGGLLNGQLRYLSKYFNLIGVSSSGGETLNKVGKQEDIAVFPVEMTRKISPFRDLKAVWGLYRLFRAEKPDIVHSITPKAGLLSMIAAFLARVPLRLHTFTGLIFPYRTGFIQQLLIYSDRILCFCATNVYPEGEGVKNDLKKFKITSKPLKVIANGNVNGVNLDYFNPDAYSDDTNSTLRKKLEFNPEDYIFLFAGRIVTDKGVNELISAFKKLSAQRTGVKLLILGDYERKLDPVLPQTEAAIENDDDILCMGWQNDVRPYFAIANCLVLPSYREGFPNTVLQAGAMRLPSIVTDISGSNEIIEEGINGSIVPTKDETALYEAMRLFASDNLHFDGDVCRKIIIDKYEQQYVWKKILEEYEGLLSQVYPN